MKLVSPMLKLGATFRILPSIALLQAFHLSVLMQCSMQMSSSGSSKRKAIQRLQREVVQPGGKHGARVQICAAD